MKTLLIIGGAVMVSAFIIAVCNMQDRNGKKK